MSAGRIQPVAERVVPCGQGFLRVRRYPGGDVWAAVVPADPSDGTRPDPRAAAAFSWPADRWLAAALRVAADAIYAEISAAEDDHAA